MRNDQYFSNQAGQDEDFDPFEETEEEFENEELELDEDEQSDEDDLFEEEETEDEASESVNVAVDEAKLRRENVQKGIEALTEADFKDKNGKWKGNGEQDYAMYSQMLNVFATMAKNMKADDAEDFLVSQRKSQVYGKHAPFKAYLPGARSKKVSSGRKASENVTLVEHQEFLDAKRAVEEVIAKVLEESAEVKAFNEVVNRLVPEGSVLTETDKDGNTKETVVSLPVFTLYCSGSNPVVNYIKQNYEAVKVEAKKEEAAA